MTRLPTVKEIWQLSWYVLDNVENKSSLRLLYEIGGIAFALYVFFQKILRMNG